MVTIRQAGQGDWSRIRDFYERTQYSSPLHASDRILLAETDSGIVGAVRLCYEGGVHVLRGMRVLERMRHRGIGTELLHATEGIFLDAVCYCIPYDHLEDFYGRAGFRKLPIADAPAFLRERWHEYRSRDLKVILMKRSR